MLILNGCTNGYLSSERRPKLETTNYTDSTSLFDLNKSSQVIGKSHELLSSTS